MASILRRGKKWYVKYVDASGTQRMVKGYTDKNETARLAHRLEDEKTKIQRGDLDPQHERRKVERAKEITAHVAEYKTALQAKGNSGNHVAYTIADIEKFIAYAGIKSATAITRPMMESWSVSLQTAGTDSRSTINRRVGSVQAFLRWLTEQGTLTTYVLNKFPKLKTNGHRRRIRRALTAAEVKKLLAKTPVARVDLYRFCLLTGARYSQAEALTVQDVRFDTKTLTFKTKDNRHRDRAHVMPLHPDLAAALMSRCEGRGREDRVWTMPARTDAAKLLREDCKAAGVDVTHVDFHALRHTMITRLAEKNVHPKVTQTLAGHADLETTLGYYTHFQRTDEAAAVALL